jgi:hypothetical protein
MRGSSELVRQFPEKHAGARGETIIAFALRHREEKKKLWTEGPFSL